MHNFTAAPPNLPGYFSPATSVVNFCEIDYAVTYYIAEFVNTLSNLAYSWLAVQTLPPGISKWNVLAWPFTNVSLLLVGFGSAAFHATLKHYAQMVDELSMYAIITSLNYRVYSYDVFTTSSSRLALGLALAVATAVVAYSNITSASGASTSLHLTLFITLLTTFWPKALSLIHKQYADTSSSSSGVNEGSRTGSNAVANGTLDKSRAEKRALRDRRFSSFRFAAFTFLAGFGVWLIDGLCCEQLRAIRAMIGLPLAWLLEFHGTWHVLTAIGAGSAVHLVADLTHKGSAS